MRNFQRIILLVTGSVLLAQAMNDHRKEAGRKGIVSRILKAAVVGFGFISQGAGATGGTNDRNQAKISSRYECDIDTKVTLNSNFRPACQDLTNQVTCESVKFQDGRRYCAWDPASADNYLRLKNDRSRREKNLQRQTNIRREKRRVKVAAREYARQCREKDRDDVAQHKKKVADAARREKNYQHQKKMAKFAELLDQNPIRMVNEELDCPGPGNHYCTLGIENGCAEKPSNRTLQQQKIHRNW